MSKIQLSGIAGIFLLASCCSPMSDKSELDVLAHDVLKSKEGIDIQITPVDKPNVKQVSRK